MRQKNFHRIRVLAVGIETADVFKARPDILKSKIDMAAKRHKKHKNKISGLVISMGYNE